MLRILGPGGLHLGIVALQKTGVGALQLGLVLPEPGYRTTNDVAKQVTRVLGQDSIGKGT